jgi:hypothetical protein
MAGVKGRSGGPRANSGGPRANSGGPRRNAGGARKGAGRKLDPQVLVNDAALLTNDPEKWLKAAMHCEAVPMKFRLKAAAYLRAQPMAASEVMDALYMKAMRGNVTAQIAYLKPWMQEKRRK